MIGVSLFTVTIVFTDKGAAKLPFALFHIVYYHFRLSNNDQGLHFPPPLVHWPYVV